MRRPRIPDVVVRRLPLYLRILEDLDQKGWTHVSSQDLGERTGLTPAQVRKDLTVFGEFGKQGIGYEVRFLKQQLEEILRLNRVVNVGLAGAGSLGMALARYNIERAKQQRTSQLRLIALFDSDPHKIGLRIDGAQVYPVNSMQEKITELGIQIMIIAVPAHAAQEVASICVKSGIKALLNFAPARLQVPPDVRLHNADLTLELQSLAFYTRGLSKQQNGEPPGEPEVVEHTTSGYSVGEHGIVEPNIDEADG
ncbi:MAG: redox-sensing transcriptional repressor Rex [Firmicutes bacterium]|nr:redox-sensing transcriptional repressor Rex [Bacillota bacterium]